MDICPLRLMSAKLAALTTKRNWRNFSQPDNTNSGLKQELNRREDRKSGNRSNEKMILLDGCSVSLNKNYLIVCRGMSEISLLSQIRSQPGCDYIVASDDIRVHKEIKNYPWIKGAYWIEQMESYYCVAPEVIQFLEIINRWLESLGNDSNGIPKELLFWIRHCEGGKTTQRIQDLLLLIRSYHYLLDTYNISKIIILRHPGEDWEDNILLAVGQSKGIAVRTMGHFCPRILGTKLLSWVKLIAREPYYIFNILRAKICRQLSPDKPDIQEKEINMQLCSSDEKHVDNILPLMNALKRGGYSPVSLHWRASRAVGIIRGKGFRAVELEAYCPNRSLWEATLRILLTWRQASRRRNEFQTHPGLQYRKINLGPLLWPSIKAFLGEELAQRYRLRKSVEKYFADHFPVAIRAWGGGHLAEGAVLLQCVNRRQRPLKFFWIMGFCESPYDTDYSYNNLLLAAGESQRKYFENLGVPSECIASVGSCRYDHLSNFRKDYSQSQSRTYLNIPSNYKNYILFDPNATLRGYLTVQEQCLVTNSLLIFVKEHQSVALMVKPHPSHRSGILESLIEYFSLPNVFLIDKSMLPYHAINSADLLITKFSAIAMEAMLFEKPVISILLDGEKRFGIYGEAVEQVYSLAKFKKILNNLINESEWRANWIKNQIENQKIFLKNYFGDCVSESAQKSAEAIDKFIKLNNNKAIMC